MRIFIVELLVLFAFLGPFFVGCTSSNSKKLDFNEEKLWNSWYSPIEDGEFSGSQVMSLKPDKSFSETKNLIFSSSDSGFEFSIKCKVLANGNWELNLDTLNLRYNGGVKVLPDRKSFEIKLLNGNDSIKISEDIKEKMTDDIYSFLVNCVEEQFNNFYGEYYPLGVVKEVTNKTLTLETENYIIKFQKFNK